MNNYNYRGPGPDPRGRRSRPLTVADFAEHQRQQAMARERHLLEIEKMREERRALAEKRKQATEAARAAKAPAAPQPSQAAPWYGPNSEEQRKAREAGLGYRDSTGKLSSSYNRTPPIPETIARPAGMAPVAGIDIEGPPSPPPTPKTYAPTALPGITEGIYGPPSGLQAMNPYAEQRAAAPSSSFAPVIPASISAALAPTGPAKPREMSEFEKIKAGLAAREPEALLRWLLEKNR
jgi:hypothetical protein